MSLTKWFARAFNWSTPQRPKPQGFNTFILEPILTPSGIVDSPGDDTPDLDLVGDSDIPDLDDSPPDNSDIDVGDISDSDIPDDDFDPIPFSTDEPLTPQFDKGVFTVGDSGKVSIDFLYDGGGYKGQLAIFRLEGMENLDTEDFIAEAANRALSNSTEGHIVIDDASEGAKFSGRTAWEGNFNSGDRQGVKEFTMNAGDTFGIMLVPNGTVEQVANNPSIGGSIRPLFSMETINPEDAFHVGQIADVTGDGNTFVMEDLRVDGWTDQDYNDIIFRVQGATGEAVDIDEVIDSNRDWRSTDWGQDLLQYVQESETEFQFLTSRILSGQDNRTHLLNAFSQSDDPRFSEAVDLLQTAALKEDFNLDEFNSRWSDQVPILEEALSDPANQNVLQSLQTNIVAFTPGFDAPNDEISQIFSNTVERYGGEGYVGNATGGVVRIGNGYVQEFGAGGAGSGAILYGDGYEQAIFLSGEEWQEFQADGGVTTQGYPTEHQFTDSSEGDPIELPPENFTLPTPSDGEIQPLASISVVQPSNSPTSPIYTNPANGNRYFLTTATSWRNAQSQATTAGGNLVTINNVAEQRWLTSIFGNNEQVWIGLTDSEQYGATEGNFRWVSGEPLTYTNWHPSEPNNASIFPEGEDFVSMNHHASVYSDSRWNDYGTINGMTLQPYLLRGIVEIPNRVPVVSASNQSVYPYQTIIPSFSANDPDGNPITSYAFYDGNASSTSGYFTVNGIKQAAGSVFYVSSSQLGSVRFVGGSTPGDDRVYVAARDPYRWGNWTNFNISTDSARNTLSMARHIVLGQSISEYVSINDRDDYYRFILNNRSRVDLSISGLSADADLRLLNASGNTIAWSVRAGSSTDSISRELEPGTYYIRVYRYSGNTRYTLSTSAQVIQPNRPPVVSASNQKVAPGQAILPSFTVSDPDGDVMTRYRFRDLSNGGGYFTLNGVPQPSGQTLEITASQLSSLRFVGGIPGDDSIQMSAFDGNLWSDWRNFTISTDTAGNTTSAARNINVTSSWQSLGEHVSTFDTDDYYRFTLNGRNRVDFNISGLSADADLYLLDAQGNTITYSLRGGTSVDAITRELNAGTYFVRVKRYSGSTKYNLNYRGTPIATGPQFTTFSVNDASGDGTTDTVFQRGALRFNWATNSTPTSVRMYARNNSTGSVIDLGNINNGGLLNLNTQQLAAGNYSIYAEARDANNNVGRSAEVPIKVLAFNPNNANSLKKGDFKDNTHTFANMTEGSVFIGRGGSDRLDLSTIHSSNVTFDPNRRTVFGGTTFDWLTINSTGQEIYFQGYEQIRLADRTINLGVTPNDPLFSQQWNLRMMDVPGAWRFTTGSNSVLLGNLDSGLNAHQDISRIIPYSSQADDDSVDRWRSHGSGVQGIMAATTNNGVGIAGINWNSNTYVIDISNTADSLNTNTALSAVGNYAQNNGQRVVVNNSWGYAPGTGAITNQRDIMNNAAYRDSALYMFSSGNDDVYPVNYPSRWSTELNNVMAIGAVDDRGLRITKNMTEGGGLSAGGYTWKWSPNGWGSNYGTGLSLVAPTFVPSTHVDGSYYIYSDSNHRAFGGTSAAAPNASGVASLVWSANSSLVSSDIRQILTSTANRSFGGFNINEYGAGIVDAEAAVRRADALGRNGEVANLFNHNGLFFI